MGFISGYPKDANISLTDKLLGTDAESSLATKNFEINDFVSFLRTQNIGSEGPIGPQGVQGIPGTPGAVGPAGLNWQGAWVSGNSYVQNDAVSYNGASWFLYTEDNEGSETENPAENTSNWALLASQGAQGPQGVQGPAGAQGPAGSLPYSIFSAKLTQTGTQNPSGVIYQNTFIGNISVVRLGVGAYGIYLPPGYDINNNLWCIIGNNNYQPTASRQWIYKASDGVNLIVGITVHDANSNTPADGLLNNTPIEIRIYN
jgi:hypothetical protein